MATTPLAYASACKALRSRPKRWLVTGCAGFIGSHLVETLLALGQRVVGLDNFSTGYQHNLDEVRNSVGADAWRRFRFVEADIADEAACQDACHGIDVVLHEAALGSVPRSIEAPLVTHASNATGFLNMLVAARDAEVSRFVYAASSSTYGDHPGLPKVEDEIGRPLSPYAVTKYLNELYADVFGRCYGTPSIGLRYFNVFGARQDPEGAYAAVIPRFAAALLEGRPVTIYGDGETTRDFCYIDNVVQANVLAATTPEPHALNQVFNIAAGGRTSLNDLYATLRELALQRHPKLNVQAPVYESFRAGDVRDSQADVSKAGRLLGYTPTFDVKSGLAEALPWYERRVVTVPRGRVHAHGVA